MGLQTMELESETEIETVAKRENRAISCTLSVVRCPCVLRLWYKMRGHRYHKKGKKTSVDKVIKAGVTEAVSEAQGQCIILFSI